MNLAGRTALALFVATFVGLAVSKRLPIGSGARGQVTFSMILVVALGPTSGYATARLLDCAIGGAVGILVALLVPERAAGRTRPRQRSTAWARGLRESLREIAAALSIAGRAIWFPRGRSTRFVDRMLDRLRAADEGLTSARGRRLRVDPVQPAGPATDRRRCRSSPMSFPGVRRLSLQVEAIALGVDALYDRASHQPRVDRADPAARLLSDAAGFVPDQSTAPRPGRLLPPSRSALGRDAPRRHRSPGLCGQGARQRQPPRAGSTSIVVELTEPSTVPVALGGDARPGERA